jgi:metal-responsive CopG/Arc/MetJ family transcriptional regulator
VKVAVSIPDDLYIEADRVAERRGVNRSALYARALRRLLAEEEGDALTRMIDATFDNTDREDLTGVARADLIDTGSWEW